MKITKRQLRLMRHNAMVPTSERLNKGDVTIENGKMRTGEFKIEVALKRGWLDHPGKYDAASRFTAAQRMAAIFQQAITRQGCIDFDRIMSASFSQEFPAEHQLGAIHELVTIARKMSRENYKIIYFAVCEGHQLHESVPPMYRKASGARTIRLCEALDDLCDALSNTRSIKANATRG